MKLAFTEIIKMSNVTCAENGNYLILDICFVGYTTMKGILVDATNFILMSHRTVPVIELIVTATFDRIC